MTDDNQVSLSAYQIWATGQLKEWKATAVSSATIYTYGFVSNLPNDDKKESRTTSIASLLLFSLLMVVCLVIQIVVPIAIFVTLPTDGLCPNQANPLTKLIGLTLCLFFVVLTIGMCLNKLRGMTFLRLFCTDHESIKWTNRFLLTIGIGANVISMVMAGICQYLLFIRNAERDYVLLLLQSLAMQFILSVDEKLMTGAWTAWTRSQLGYLLNGDGDDLETDSERLLDEETTRKVRLMYTAEETFLIMVSSVGIGWSIALAYCM